MLINESLKDLTLIVNIRALDPVLHANICLNPDAQTTHEDPQHWIPAELSCYLTLQAKASWLMQWLRQAGTGTSGSVLPETRALSSRSTSPIFYHLKLEATGTQCHNIGSLRQNFWPVPSLPVIYVQISALSKHCYKSCSF
jgi:hypothetical protein